MSPGNPYISIRSNLFEPSIFYQYLDKFDFKINRKVQIINLFTVKPVVTRFVENIERVQKQDVIKKIRDIYNIDSFYNILLFPNRFSAYYSFLYTICDLNDEIITPSPYPHFIRQYVNCLGLNLNKIETSMEDDFKLPYREMIEKKISSRTKMVYYNSPSFSGSIVYDRESLERLLFVAQNYHLYLVSDETLSSISVTDENYISMQDIALQSERIVKIFSPFENLSMGDLTVFVYHKALPGNIGLFSDELFPVSLYSLSALDYLIKNKERLIEEKKEEYIQKKELIDEFIQNREDIYSSISYPAGSIFISLPVPNTESFVEWLLTEYNRDRKTIFVAPASHFHSKNYDDNGEVLIDYRFINLEILEEGLEILSDALDRYLGLKKEEE